MNTAEKIAESNRIEGIERPPTAEEIAEHERFILLAKPTVEDLERFVRIYQPGAVMRDVPGRDVRVGRHVPPLGGPHIRDRLAMFLDQCNKGILGPWAAHVDYEMLHPFTDGNGRSGRVLWYWLMEAQGYDTGIGFLHAFYYQTLQRQP